MGWESRRGTTKKYYTRTVRIGKRRKRSNFGNGPLAQIAELQDGLLRIERELRQREESHCPPDAPAAAPVAQDGDDRSDTASENAGGARSVATEPETQAVEGRTMAPSFFLTPPGRGANLGDYEADDEGPLARIVAEVEAAARTKSEAAALGSVKEGSETSTAAGGYADASAAIRGQGGSATESADSGPSRSGEEACPARGKSNVRKRSKKREESGECLMEYTSYASGTHAGAFELASRDEGHWQPDVRAAMTTVAEGIHRFGPQRGDHRGVAVYQQGNFLFWIRTTRVGLGICLSVTPPFESSGEFGGSTFRETQAGSV